MPIDSIDAFLKKGSPSLIPACRFTRGNTVTIILCFGIYNEIVSIFK